MSSKAVRVRVIGKEFVPLVLPKTLAAKLQEISPSSLAQRMVLEAAVSRALDVESERIKAAWDEYVRKQAKRMGWRW